MTMVNKYLNQFKLDAEFEAFLNKLTVDQVTTLLEIIQKNFEMIAQGIVLVSWVIFLGNASTSSTLMLKLHAKILELKGIAYQLRSITRRHPL